MNIENLINEEIKKILKENNLIKEDDKSLQKSQAVKNINQHIRLLKYLKNTIKQIKLPPEYEKMIELVKAANTGKFLTEFLGVKDDMPVKVNAVLSSPLELISAVIDEVINVAYKNATQKLKEAKEGGLPPLDSLGKEYDPKNFYSSKRKEKERKKDMVTKPVVDPGLFKEDLKKREVFNLIQKLEKKAEHWKMIADRTQDEKEKIKADDMSKQFSGKAEQLKQRYGIEQKPEYSDEDIFEEGSPLDIDYPEQDDTIEPNDNISNEPPSIPMIDGDLEKDVELRK